MDQFNTPWRVTSAAIYTTPTDSRVYGTLDIDVTEAKRFIDEADFAPGYMRRGTGRLPKQGDREPWTNIQNYYVEKDVLPKASFEDGVLQFH